VIRGAIGDTGRAYCTEGRQGAPAVIFSNSLGTDHRLWDAQVEAVRDRYSVIRYEACGHGESDPPRGPVTIEKLGTDVIALLDHVDIQRAVVCGCSLGGVIALWMSACRRDRVAGAVLANTGAKVGTMEGWTARIAAVRAGGTAAVRDVVVGRFLTPEFRAANPAVLQRVNGMFEATDRLGYIAACEALRDTDLRPVAPTVRVPTLIVGSDRDESTPLALSHELHAAIADSELVVIKGAAHLSHVEQPDAFNASLVSFLDRVFGGPAT